MRSFRIRNSLFFLVILLYFVSLVTPMVFANNAESSKSTDLDKQLENLAFYCATPNGFNNAKYEYYKQQLKEQYSSKSNNNNTDGVVESENTITQTRSQSNSLSFGPMDSPWPMQSHDVHHTGQSPYSTADNPSVEKWRFYTDGWLEDTPVIDNDGTIYFGGNYGGLPWYLFAVNPDGTEKWKYKTGGLIWGSSPAIAVDGTIYVGSWDTKLYAINPDGTQKWATGSGGSIASSPVIAEDGTIYFGTMSSGNSIVAMNPNGTIKWSYQTGYSVVSDPCISLDGTVYCGSGDGGVYALWPNNGTLRWSFQTGDEIHGSPAISIDGSVYCGSWDDCLYAFDPDDGSLIWSFNTGWGPSNSPAIDVDGIIYAGNNRLYALYPNGTEKWSFDLGDRDMGHSSPAVSADGTIYVGLRFSYEDGGEIIAINHDGTEKWRKKIAGFWVKSSPSIAEDGTVYIGSSADMSRGYLHAFNDIESNSPPASPVISGPSSINAGKSYWFTFVAVDPDNNPIELFVDWGDGNSGWVDWGWSASGETMWTEHTWSTQGSYQIKAKVKDILGEESGWGYLDVTVPRVRIFNLDFFIQYLESHPYMFPLIRILLKV